MTIYTVPEKTKVRFVDRKWKTQKGKRPSTTPKPPPQTLLAYKISLLPETHHTEPLDLEDILADMLTP